MSEPAPAPASPPPAKRRRVLRGVAVGVVALVGALLLAPVAAWLWLSTESGGRFVRARVLSALAGQLRGRVEIDRVAVSGLLRVELSGVRLFAPGEDEPVVSVGRAAADVRALALLARRLELAELTVETPVVRLVNGPGGSNLDRALESVEPPAPGPPAEPSATPRLTVRAPAVRVRGAAFTMSGDGSVVGVEAADLDASLDGTLEDLEVRAGLRLRARQPVDREVALALVARWKGDELAVEKLSAHSGSARLAVFGRAKTDLSSAQVHVEELVAGASDVAEFVPEPKLLGEVSLSGDVSLEAGRAKAALVAGLPAGGRLELNADATLPEGGKPLRYEARVSARGVDLARTAQGLPAALVRADLQASGEGIPGEGRASVRLDASGSRYEGLAAELLEVRARLQGTNADIERLSLRAAGLAVQASGRAGPERGNVRATVDAPDLGRTREALARGLKLELPELKGAAQIDARVDGSWSAPAVELTVRTPALSSGDNGVAQAKIEASLRSLSPLRGTLALEAQSGRAAGLEAKAFSLGASVDGRTVRADVGGTFDGNPVEVRLRGEREAAARGVERWAVSTLELRALGLSGRQQGTSRVVVAGERASVEGLVLDGDLGRLELSGSGGASGPLSAQVSLRGLKLEKVPRALLPEGFDAAGTATLEAEVSGTVDAPVAQARLRLAGGRWKALGPAALALDARYEAERVAATASLELPRGGSVSLVADGRPDAMDRREEPLQATVTVKDLDLALAGTLDPELAGLSGRLGGTATVSGSLAQPRAEAHLALANGAARNVDKLDAKVDATYAEREARATVVLRRPRALGATLSATAPVDLGAYLRTFELDYERLPVEAALALDELDLRWLANLGFVPPDLAGVVSGRLSAAGTLQAPRADGTISIRGLAAAGRTGLDATLDLSAREEVSAVLRADLDGRPALAASLRVPRTVQALLQADPATVPVTLEASLRPVPLARLMPPDAPPPVKADVSATLRAVGTADDPQVRVTASVDGMELEGRKVGRLEAEAGYREGLANASATFRSTLAGELFLRASVPGRLGLGVLRDGGVDALLDRRAEVKVDTANFDVALAEGFVPGVKDLGGRLDVHLRHEGPLRSPVARGTVSLRDGRAYVLEMGGFGNVALEAELADKGGQALVLHKLAGRSGSGRFEAKGRLAPAGAGRDATRSWEKLEGSLEASVTELPLVQSYQTRAFLTLKMKAAGTQTTWRDLKSGESRVEIHLPEVRLSDGLVLIPERLQKSVQSLEPNPDIVVAGREAGPPEEEEGGARRSLSATVVVPDDLRVEAPLGTKLVAGARLLVELDPRYAQAGGSSLRVTGTAKLLRGKLNLVYRTFDIDDGRLDFRGPADDPALDIKAHYTGPDQTEVNVAVGGTASEPTTNFTSKPPMDKAEILYYLATNQRQTRAKTEAVALSEQAADTGLSILGSLAAGLVKNVLEKAGARDPEISVEADSASGKVKGRGGLYLNDRVYVGLQYHHGANPMKHENAVELEMRVRVTEGAGGRVHYGDAGQWGLEALWQKDIPTARQRKAKKADEDRK